VFLGCIKYNTQYIKGMSIYPEVLIFKFYEGLKKQQKIAELLQNLFEQGM
jgi:hypothetical protein